MSSGCTKCFQEKSFDKFYTCENTYYDMCKSCCYKNQIAQCIECKNIKNHSNFYKKTTIFAISKKCIQCYLNTEYKQCPTCEIIKKFSNFYIHKQRGTLRRECKLCVKIRKSKWRDDNREWFNKQTAEYRSRPDVKIRSSEYQKEYYRKPGVKEHKAALAKINDNIKYHNNPEFKIKKILRSRLNTALKGLNKSFKTIELLDCSIDLFKQWLEYQFDVEMSWENQGTYWHIDHVKPCSSFDLTKESEQLICFNWKNLRPLNGIDNIQKRDIYNDIIRIKHEIMLKSFIMQYKIKK